MTLFDPPPESGRCTALGCWAVRGVGSRWCPAHAITEQPMPDFDGETYERPFDYERLGDQMRQVARFMLAHDEWWTLAEIAGALCYPEASISARLRDLRKPKFGSHLVERRPRGERAAGLFEYRVTRPTLE